MFMRFQKLRATPYYASAKLGATPYYAWAKLGANPHNANKLIT
jgi:hypothetical protein